jgi:hypothetical protein
MVNCNNQSQEAILSKAVPPDQFELSGMQNMFEWLLPNDIEIQLGNETYMEAMAKGMNNKESLKVYEGLKQLGLIGKSNESIKLTKDIRHLYAAYA